MTANERAHPSANRRNQVRRILFLATTLVVFAWFMSGGVPSVLKTLAYLGISIVCGAVIASTFDVRVWGFLFERSGRSDDD